MRKQISILTLIAGLFATSSVFAGSYPILETYKATAQQLLSQTQAAKTAQDLDALKAGTHTLIDQGVQIMKLYAEKNPNCQAQFSVFLQELPTMETKSLDEVHARYHNGDGLPAAPRHCYFGRSQVVHPVMNLIRMKGAWTADTQEEVTDDFNEVIEHLEKIQKNLDNPPN